MNRKPVFYSNKHGRKNIAELSPRLAVKRAELTSNGVVIAQASAQMKRRKQDAKIIRLQSPVYSRSKAELNKINQQKLMLTQQQIRNSALYKMLQQQIKQLARRQEQEILKLKKIKQQRKKESETLKKQQFAVKLQIWQLKNQVFDIKELIQQQKNESERLTEEIRPLGSNNNLGDTEQQQQIQPDLTGNQSQSYQTQQQS